MWTLVARGVCSTFVDQGAILVLSSKPDNPSDQVESGSSLQATGWNMDGEW